MAVTHGKNAHRPVVFRDQRDLANARTFCFFEEIEYLIKNGLIKISAEAA